MTAKQQLAIAESCQKQMDDAGINFAIVCAFPEGGGALLGGGDLGAENENGETIPQLMRFYAGVIEERGE